MIIKNVTSGAIIISDIPGPQPGEGLELPPGATITIFNDQAQESAQLNSFLTSGQIANLGPAEPSSGTPVSTSGPQVVARVDVLGLGANTVAPIVILASVPATGFYRVSSYHVCVADGVSGPSTDTVPILSIAYVDESGPNSANIATTNAPVVGSPAGSTVTGLYLVAGDRRHPHCFQRHLRLRQQVRCPIHRGEPLRRRLKSAPSRWRRLTPSVRKLKT
jgi:hypothetical protein